MYFSEIWILTDSKEKRIGAAEMHFVTSVPGITLRERITSEDVRRNLQILYYRHN